MYHKALGSQTTEGEICRFSQIGHVCLFHSLFKTEHAVPFIVAVSFLRVTVTRAGVARVEKFDVMDAAAVDVEIYVPLFEIRSYRFPDFDLRVCFFDLAPRGIADALAVNIGRDEQDLKVASVAFDSDYDAADGSASPRDAIRFSPVDRLFYRFTGNDLTFFFKGVVSYAEFLKRPVIERLLIVKNEALPVFRSQGNKLDIIHFFASPDPDLPFLLIILGNEDLFNR